MALRDWPRDGRGTLLAATLGIGLGVSSAVCVARSLGWFEGVELPAYDRFVRWQVGGGATPGVAIVRIREEEIAKYGHPLPDAVLADALRAIADAGASAIGVDLYRDPPRSGEPRAGYDDLARLVANDDRVFLIEKLPQPGDPGVAAPEFARTAGRVGFSDVVIDSDGVVRRGLLILWDEADRPSLSLALVLALRALRDEGATLEPDPEHPEFVRLGGTTIEPLTATTGGYATADAGGYQFLLDLTVGDALPSHALEDVLQGDLAAPAFRDRVVLIGTTSHSVKDDFVTAASGGGLVHGVALHAEAVDQLLRIARDGATPRRAWSDASEWAWIFAWGLAGGALAFVIPHPLALALGALCAVGVLLAIAAASFAGGVWIPWVSPGVASLASSGLVLAERSRRERAERRAVMDLFGRYVSRTVADELWRRRDEFMHGGRPVPQRLVITAMLTDLKGYTQAAEALDPVALMEWVNGYMDAMTRVIEAHGGVVDDYTGDGIKANFGVPIASAGGEQVALNARAAVRCAIQMGETLEDLARTWQEQGWPIAPMRIGLFTGVAVGGSLGSAERMKYTTVGDTVNTAARLESFHKEDFERPAADGSTPLFRILIGDTTRKHLDEDEFELEDLGVHALRGRVELVRIHRVWGPRTGRKETT